MYLSFCLSQPSFFFCVCLSARISLTVTLTIFLFSLCLFPLFYRVPSSSLFLPAAVLCRLLFLLVFPRCLFLVPAPFSCPTLFFVFFLLALVSLRLSLCFLLFFFFLPLCLCLCILLSFTPSPFPCVSPDIHVEIFSHVRYRFMTPARSLWPLNLIQSTKPHCFCVCVCVCACLLCG